MHVYTVFISGRKKLIRGTQRTALLACLSRVIPLSLFTAFCAGSMVDRCRLAMCNNDVICVDVAKISVSNDWSQCEDALDLVSATSAV